MLPVLFCDFCESAVILRLKEVSGVLDEVSSSVNPVFAPAFAVPDICSGGSRNAGPPVRALQK